MCSPRVSTLRGHLQAVKENMCHLGLDDKAPVGPYHCMAIRLATDDETQVRVPYPCFC